MEESHQEMQLLSCTSTPRAASSSSAAAKFQSAADPSLDLQLSISVRPPSERVVMRKVRKYKDVMKMDSSCVEALKWQAAEQIRLAAMEKAYAERVRELTRREMELAQSEFARARALWDRARDEVQRAERMKQRATQKMDSACMEITCQSCRHKFRPANN